MARSPAGPLKAFANDGHGAGEEDEEADHDDQ
jgi:hypothetical protein